MKEFLAELVNRADTQETISARILAGDTTAFFRAVAYVLGKPRETVDMNVSGDIEHWLQEAREAARRSKC